MTISSKWLDFPAMAAGDTAAADIVPYGDMSEPVGTRQRIATLETLRSYLTADAHVAEVDPVVTDDETKGFAIGRLWFNKAVGSEALFIALGVTTGAAVWEDVFALAGVDGDVVGPASAVDARIVTFDGTTGKLVQDSGSTVADFATAAQGALADTAVQPADPIGVNAQTGTTYTLALSDAGKLVTLTNAGAIALTVPLNSSVAFAVGAQVDGAQLGAGLVSIAGAAGVTINGVDPGSEASVGQWSRWRLAKLTTDSWLASGDLA